MGDATSSSENDASSGEGPNAKRSRRDPDAPKPTFNKGVRVLLDSDVSVSSNGQVLLPNAMEMAKLKKPEKGQYCRINFTSEMTEREVRSTLHSNLPIIRNKRLGCASFTSGKLDFHGGKRMWNGAEIKKFAKSNSALYLLAEDSHDSEDSQVLTGGTVPVAAARPLNVHTSVAGPSRCDQKEPVLNVQTQQKKFEFGMISIPQHQQCLGQDTCMTTRKRTAPQRGFSQQSSTVSTSKKQKNGTCTQISGNQGFGKSCLIGGGFVSLGTSHGKSGLRVEGLAFEQSVNEDSMTTPVQHYGQIDLGGKTTTRESALKQSMSTSVAQASVLAATQRLKELSQVHASVSSTADQRHDFFVTGMGSTSVAVVSNANHEGEPEMFQRGEEDLTAQPDHTIDDILQQGLSVVQKRPNGPIVQATVDPAPQKSLNPASVTCKRRELIAQSSEQGSSLQQSPAVAAAHTNVPAKGLSSQTTSAKELPDSARKRKSHPHGHQEFKVLVAVSEGEITDSGIDSLENESNHDTDQLRDIVLEISPSKGSTKGGDKFHIILQDICPLEIESFVAVFQFRETEQVHLKQTNLFTYTGITPKSLQGPGPVNVTLMSLDGSWWGGEAEFEYIDEDEEYLRMVVTNKDKRRQLFDRLHEELSNKQSDRQTSNSPDKTGPGLSSLNQSRCAWSVKLLQLLVYKAAEVGGQEFIQMIFSTLAGKVVFDSYRNIATLPEDVARVNGHSTLADYLQDVNNSLSKESNSDAGTEDIDWLELKHAVDKEQSLTSGTDDAQISEKCQPPGYQESDDDEENDYFADDEMSPCSSPCLSPSYTNLRDSENEDHSQNTNMIESSYEKEVNGENLSVENNDSSEFPLHLVGNQLEVIPSIKAEHAGYKHKQLDSDDVESYSSGDDITEKEYDSAVPCLDEVENWETVESEDISAIKETSARTTSSRNATHESGLDGDQKELRMTNDDETSRSRLIEFLRKNEEYEEVNIPTENKDSSVFYPHLKVIPPIQGVNDGYEHKQLDYEEVKSHRSEDDMHENENVYRVFKTDQNELNKITIPSGKRTTQLYPALPSISSYRDTDDVVVTDVSEWGLDGHQKELRMTVDDETTRSRGSHEETPCDAAVMRNLESSFSRTIEIVLESSFEKEVNGESNLLVKNSDSFEFSLHLVGDIPSMKPKSARYEHKQSYSSGDDITEKEYESTVPCRDEVENWETVESKGMSAIKETSAGTTSSRNATHESGLDGDQKELTMTDHDETSRSGVFYVPFSEELRLVDTAWLAMDLQEIVWRVLDLKDREKVPVPWNVAVWRFFQSKEIGRDSYRLFLRDSPFERAVLKRHQTLNEAKLNFFSAFSFLSAAYSKNALHVNELGRARALADLMTARYSMDSQISCKCHSWTYLDEIVKKERSSTCLYISCYGQDVFLRILKRSGAISLRKVKVGNNFLHDKLATNLDAVFAMMANSVLSEEDCNNQSVHDIEPEPDSSQILSSCYKLLIDPVSDLLKEPSMIIVPKGSLCLVPFAALLNDESGMYLSDSFRIRVVPSLSTLKLIQDSPADYHSQTGALVVGDPTVGEVIYRGSVSRKFVPLPGARKEAEMVGRLLGVQPLLGQNATKQAILQMLHSVSLIHIAAHGSADRGEIALAPLVPTSGILQEDDYLLKLSDISQVQLRAKLVVLSCCHSGRGQVRSEGIIGMAQAFLGSGARSVLVALGALNDRATEQLMCHFYEHLVRGESASESLHQAMKWMRGNGFTKVSDWAPFTLIGDDVTFDFREYSRKEESNQTKQVVT